MKNTLFFLAILCLISPAPNVLAWGDGSWHPDQQIYPISPCVSMGEGNYYCDGGLEFYCPSAKYCNQAAVSRYNECAKACNKAQDPDQQANCFSECEIDFQADLSRCALDYCY